jgi:hypothetical protein
MFQDHLGLNATQAKWSYETTTRDGRKRKLSLDARIQLTDISSLKQRRAVSKWLAEATKKNKRACSTKKSQACWLNALFN